MRKITLFILILSCLSGAAFAQVRSSQSSAAAHQRVSMQLNNILEFTFTNTNSNKGGIVSIPFSNMRDYTQGVSTGEQELRIRTNKKFSIGVQSSASYFDYTGSAGTTVTKMPVDSVLDVEVSANHTGGQILPPFGTGKFVALSSRNLNIVNNGNLGGDQRFSVKYKATPGISYGTGTYTVDVIFTATQQ